MPPLTAIVRRRVVNRQPDMTPAMRNVRPVENITQPAEVSDPPRQGDVPSRPARQQIVTALNIAGIRSVMRDEFWISVFAPRPGAQTLQGPGHQLPWLERANVHKPAAEAYGSLFTLDPVDLYGAAVV